MSIRVRLPRALSALQLLILVAMAGLFAGCQTTEPQFQDLPPEMLVSPAPGTETAAPPPSVATTASVTRVASTAPAELAPVAAPSVTATAAATPAVNSTPITPMAAEARSDADIFRVGDTVSVDFSGLPGSELPKPHEERIKDDGTITLYLVGTVRAAGRNPGDLQRELQKEYDKYYKNLVVTVSGLQRVFYVGGEVKRPSAYPYLGPTTVTQAIQTAGDFTDFAKKGSILVTRADGSTLTVNFGKVIDEPRLDPPILPGDKIYVPRRILW